MGLNLDDVVYSDDPGESIDNIIDPSSYSTDEKWTGGYWIDNKPIYKKTINFGALPNTSYKAVAHGITNLDYVIEINGITYDGNRFRPLIMPNATSGAWSAPEADNTDIYIYTGTDQSGRTAYVTLYYTKSS